MPVFHADTKGPRRSSGTPPPESQNPKHHPGEGFAALMATLILLTWIGRAVYLFVRGG
jgi:hypothetical protein